MKRPAHLTLVDADKIGAVFTQRTEWRERAEKAEARNEALEKAEKKTKGGVDRALFYLRQIVGAVDGVMADWEHEKSAELVPTTIGQWAERAIIKLAAPRGEEET